ncbi:hypothetical protein DPSP01_006124 [Paraphaeosphaeria sporulosa]
MVLVRSIHPPYGLSLSFLACLLFSRNAFCLSRNPSFRLLPHGNFISSTAIRHLLRHIRQPPTITYIGALLSQSRNLTRIYAMSVPLEGLALYDMDERVHRARVMAEYRRQALEELKHIQIFQKQHPLHQNAETEGEPARPTTPKTPATIQAPEAGTEKRVGKGVTDKPLKRVAARATPNKTTQTPRKPGKKIKGMFTWTPKKKTQEEISDIRRAMGPESYTPLTPGRPRTTDPSAGGQLPGEDSWEWYQRNMTALPPMASLPPVPALPCPRSTKHDVVHPSLRKDPAEED